MAGQPAYGGDANGHANGYPQHAPDNYPAQPYPTQRYPTQAAQASPGQVPSATVLTEGEGWSAEAPQPWHDATPTAPISPVQVAPAPMPPPAPAPAEQWVYVDPSAYSNPYTEAPVYTSGPQPAAPPPVAAVPVVPVPLADPHQAGFAPEAGPDGGATTQAGSAPPDSHHPERGELGIKERRSWKTWQLLLVALVAAVLGMGINGNVGAGSSTSSTASSGGYKLPPPSSGAVTTTAPANAGGGATKSGSATAKSGSGSSSSTGSTTATTAATAAGAGSGTDAGSSTTTSPVAVGPATVLVPEVQQTGNWTSPAFTIAGGTWNIGWAFQCTPAPATPPSFEIFAVPSGSAAGSTPAVTSSASSGNSVTPLTSTGSQQIIVQTTAACRWAVKVTGAGS